jgi:type I restriction enzyme S subunit
MNEWKEVALEDVADDLTVGHVGSMASEYVESGIPFLRSLNVEPFRINETDIRYITPEFHARAKKSTLRPGDVVIVRTGKPGATAIIPDWLTEANCSDLVIVRPGNQLDRRFLVYFMNSVARIHISAHLVGAVQQHFNVGSARKIKIPLPPLREQQAIACILGAFDDKIELNRRRNRTLEAMARAIFQSWFVDFDPVKAKAAVRREHPRWTNAQVSRAACPKLKPEIAELFPDRFEDSPLGPIPAGWRVGTLREVAEIRGGKQLPTEECLQNARYVVFGANGIMGYSTQSTHNGFVIAFGRVGAYCGSVHWSLDGAWINNNASSVRPFKWPAFVLQSMLEVDFTTMRTGSAQPFIPNSSLAAASIVLPEPKVADAYEVVAFPMRQKQASLRTESRTLAALRDALLPKLISGELRVPDAERIVGRAV